MKGYSLQVELTNHCNFRCWQCPHVVYPGTGLGGNRFDRKKGFMSKELFTIILENAQKYARVIELGFFGEQILHPQFNEFISLIPNDRTYRLRINTNWSLTTKKLMETLKKFDKVRVSLDASYKDLFNELRPGKSAVNLDGTHTTEIYDTIVHKLKYWLNLPDHSPTDLVFVMSSKNVGDQASFVRQWKSEIGSKDHLLKKLILSYGGIMYDTYMMPNPCKIPERNIFVVGWNGDCSPCNLDVNLELKSGNLLITPDIEKIVKSQEWQQTLDKIRRKEGICSKCYDANNWSRNKWYSPSKRKVYKIKQSKIKTPLYSVVIPIRDQYNASLFNCLESLHHQTMNEIEIIISDYGSSIDYKSILSFLKPFDCTVYYYPTKAMWNTSIARNLGIRRARTQHTLSLDADLILEPRTLELLYDCHLKHPRSLIVSQLCYLPKKEFNKPGIGAVMSAPQIWWNKVRGFDERMRGWGGPDTDLWKRAGLDGMNRIIMPNINGNSTIYHQYHPPTRYKQRRGIYYLLYRLNRFIWRFDKSIIRNNENWGVWS